MKILIAILILLPYQFTTANSRIVSLTPSITETLIDLGLQRKIVGSVDTYGLPSLNTSIAIVGHYQKPSVEKIMSLNPTIILTQSEGVDRFSKQINGKGIELETFPSHRLADFTTMTKRLSQKFSVEKRGEKVIKEFENSFSQIPIPIRTIPIIVLIESGSGIFLGTGNFLNEVFERCGGRNLITKSGYPKLNIEYLSTLRPEKIFILEEKKKGALKSLTLSSPVFRDTPKVFLDTDKYSRLTLRLARASKSLCQKVMSAP